VQKQTLGAVGN